MTHRPHPNADRTLEQVLAPFLGLTEINVADCPKASRPDRFDVYREQHGRSAWQRHARRVEWSLIATSPNPTRIVIPAP